jgi:hypothetical protein
VQAICRTLFFVREGRKKKVRVITENDSKVSVIIVEVKRDKDGKMKRKTVDSHDVAEATGEEVSAFVYKALTGNSSKK